MSSSSLSRATSDTPASLRWGTGVFHLLHHDEVAILGIDTEAVIKGDLTALVLVALGLALVLGDVAIGDFVLRELDDGARGVSSVFELWEGGSHTHEKGNGGELHDCVRQVVPCV